MTHHNIHISDYHEGDALHIPVVVEDSDGDRVNLTGAEMEWLLKADPLDDDAEALVHKESANGDDEIEITTAIDGEATIKLSTGDTDTLLTDPVTSERLDERVLHHRARVIDDAGRRATIFHGDFEIVI